MAATLSYAPFEKIPSFAIDCKNMGIKIEQPDINSCVPAFAPTVGGKTIRYGLASIKSVANAANVLYDLRKEKGEVKDFRDFILRAVLFGISSAAAKALIQSGALDSIMKDDEYRSLYAENIEEKLAEGRKAVKALAEDLSDNEKYQELLATWEMPRFSSFPEKYTQEEKLSFERDLLGLYVSGNPIEPHLKKIQSKFSRDVAIERVKETPRVTIAGIIRDVSIIHRKSDGAPMAKFVVEDETGSIDAIMFTKHYARFRTILTDGCVAKVTGRIEVDGIDEIKKQISVNDFTVLE